MRRAISVLYASRTSRPRRRAQRLEDLAGPIACANGPSPRSLDGTWNLLCFWPHSRYSWGSPRLPSSRSLGYVPLVQRHRRPTSPPDLRHSNGVSKTSNTN